MLKNSGFTLVELLAVIVVLSIIALIGFGSIGNIIESATTSADKLTIKEYAKAVDRAVLLYEMNNSDKVINIDQEWITNNVKFEKSTVQCERIEYDKFTNLYGCKVNNVDNTYCYSDDVASECNKDKLYKIYGNSVQNRIPTPGEPVEIQSVGDSVTDASDIHNGEYKIPVKLTNESGESETINIYLKEPLRKIGDYADYIDLKNKKVVRQIKEYILTGEESGQYYFESGNNFNGLARILYRPYKNDGISGTKFLSNQLSNAKETDYKEWTLYNASSSKDPRCFIYFPKEYNKAAESTATSLPIQFIRQQYSNGNPIKIYGVVKETVEEDITDVPTIPELTGTIEYTIGTELAPSNIEYEYKNS